MNNTASKIGERFSQTYEPPDPTANDSERFRRRLAGFLLENAWIFRYSISSAITRELGIEVPVYWDKSGQHHPDLKKFFETSSIRDVLDSVTVIYRVIIEKVPYNQKPTEQSWRQFVERVLREEGMQYSLDASAGVRYVVDGQFERTRVASISSLAAIKMDSVSALVEQAFEQLSSLKADPKAAIRLIFEAMETFCKKQFNSNQDLTEAFITKTIAPWITSHYSKTDETMKMSGDRLIQGMKSVVNTAHIYRHGQNTPNLLQPAPELAVAIVGQSANFLRWLASIVADIGGTQANKTIEKISRL